MQIRHRAGHVVQQAQAMLCFAKVDTGVHMHPGHHIEQATVHEWHDNAGLARADAGRHHLHNVSVVQPRDNVDLLLDQFLVVVS